MTCFVNGCDRAAHSRQLCHTHYEYSRKHGQIALEAERRAALIEDVEWMLANGETHAEAVARRLGLTASGIVRRLERHGRVDLLARLSGCYTDTVRRRVAS